MANNIVVVGVDGTRTSILGAKEALWLAGQLSAELHLVNVAGLTETSSEHGLAEVLMEGVVEGVTRDHDGDTEIITAITYGSPAAALVAYADEVDATILVAGNRQMKGLGRMLGSVGAQIARDANCAVYIPRTVEQLADEEAAADD